MGQHGFKNLLEQVQSVAPDINTRGSTAVDESSIQYNSDDENHTETLTSELFEADEYSKEPFEWRERPLKPNTERPVLIHRAVLGSVERFIAMLAEHTAGKWPFWLSPRQVCICPISDATIPYAKEVEHKLKNLGY